MIYNNNKAILLNDPSYHVELLAIQQDTLMKRIEHYLYLLFLKFVFEYRHMRYILPKIIDRRS